MGEPTATNPPSTASRGDSDRRARFRAVYDAHYHLVLGYVLRRTATREDAEDVVAETFLAAWRRLEDVPPGPGGRLWLYGIARNTLANYRRGERRRGRLAGRLHAESGPSLAVDADDEVVRVAAAFARLREDDRELLALAAWEGLDPGEIAAVLACSRNAARIRLHRARRRFARQLQGKEVDSVSSASARSLTEAMREEGAR
jgi:RNA polymerase sigma factor (sigma-70 family)